MDRVVTSSYKEVMKFLECPICFETIYPPIFQCTNGHMICSTCMTKVGGHCPICRIKITGERSFPLERYLDLVRINCVYSLKGCTEVFSYEEKLHLQLHEKSCKFRPPFKCPQCTVMGDVSQIVNHLQHTHKVNYIQDCKIDIEFPNLLYGERKSQIIAIKYCLEYFLVGLETYVDLNLEDGHWYWFIYVMIMGEEEEANKYRCVLKMERDSGEIEWRGKVSSCRMSKQKIFDNKNGLLLSDDCSPNFSLFWWIELEHPC